MAAVVVAGALSSLAGCRGLEFRQDQRLTFTAPRANALTEVPVTVSWRMRDFSTSAPEGGQFAVFLDRSPLRVGANIRSVLAQGDPFSEQELERQRVYLTRNPTVVLSFVPKLLHSKSRRQRHSVTVVLLDGSGTRRTESAWIRSFDLNAKGAL